jgi:hypothetical protein
MTFLIILTIWITLTLLIIRLCFAARLGDLQLAAVYALPPSIHHGAPRPRCRVRAVRRPDWAAKASRRSLTAAGLSTSAGSSENERVRPERVGRCVVRRAFYATWR